MGFLNKINMNRILTSSVRSVCNSKTLFGRRSTKGARNYASMQDLKLRIGVVESVEKITSSMKMVSAAKLKVAQGHVDPAVRFFESTKRVFTDLEADPEALKDLQAESTADADAPHMIVAITTDRGLCGAITSNVCRVAVEQAKTHRKENVVFSSLGTKGQDNLVAQHFRHHRHLQSLCQHAHQRNACGEIPVDRRAEKRLEMARNRI